MEKEMGREALGSFLKHPCKGEEWLQGRVEYGAM